MLGILLLAHGGPGSLGDVPAFLERVRQGRPLSERLLEEVRDKYRLIGGASPLPEIVDRVATKLNNTTGLPTYTGMLHWHPFVEETIAQMVAEGVSRALVICLVPHFSECSVGRYRSRTESAANIRGLAFDFVESWHTSAPYIQGLADSIAACWSQNGPLPDSETHIVFSAHSLPKAALPPNDPYEAQLLETAEQVAARLGLRQEEWTLAYQSANDTGRDWLGPSIDAVMNRLAEQGKKRVIVCPFGFVADQVEVLYDLDVVAKQKALELGMQLIRAPLLNDSPALVDSLALLVERWRR